ncbi:hypothetical protein FRC04_005086 [Tulasnella sp. 424]|nr:hypothetical protein FRC04_005086 [Tulasnella sp. 424]KAG8964749.1 hypothetical protein FRC05_003589 [Tulasnella sp. 425]
MDRLPQELLSSIFLTLLPIPLLSLMNIPQPARDRSRDLTTLRLVSKNWNQNILDTPELWSYITVSPEGTDALRYLPRSKAAPLHVRIALYISDGGDPQDIRAAIEALWREANRWTTYYVSTYRIEDSETYAWFRLMPPVPLPKLREARLEGPQHVELQCPGLKRLHQWQCTTNIHLGGFPALQTLVTKQPTTHQEWERLLLVSQQCTLLKSLRLTEPWSFERQVESQPGGSFRRTTLAFHNLEELKLVANRVALDFITHLHAPVLGLLVIRRYDSPIPFSIPPSCPALNRIRFTHRPDLDAIQEVLSTFPPARLQNLTIELEMDEYVPELFTQKRKIGDERIHWLQKHVSGRFVHLPSEHEERRRCRCREEHAE